MNRWRLCFIAILFATGSASLEARKLSGDNLSDMIIQGENRLKVHPKLTETPWPVNPYRDVKEILRDTSLVARLEPPVVAHPPVVLPVKSLSTKTARPWFFQIPEPPLLRINVKVAQKKLKGEWAFIVKDSQGRVFDEIKKIGSLPDSLAWNGNGKTGGPLRVGQDYSYSFTFTDEGGNPQRFSGNSFRLDAFRVPGAGKSVSFFQSEVIFGNRSSLRLSPDGKAYLTEMKDFIRTQFHKQVLIAVYEDDPGFGLSRAGVIREFLQNALDIPDDRIISKGMSLEKEGGYRHVEITTK